MQGLQLLRAATTTTQLRPVAPPSGTRLDLIVRFSSPMLVLVALSLWWRGQFQPLRAQLRISSLPSSALPLSLFNRAIPASARVTDLVFCFAAVRTLHVSSRTRKMTRTLHRAVPCTFVAARAKWSAECTVPVCLPVRCSFAVTQTEFTADLREFGLHPPHCATSQGIPTSCMSKTVLGKFRLRLFSQIAKASS